MNPFYVPRIHARKLQQYIINVKNKAMVQIMKIFY